ncbi:MAG: DNA-formamidopyrimidine glycosylase [Clostridia bacterium]|nr:DNA-formamidopyrimidine glycosylase [Clostridia bacterium]
MPELPEVETIRRSLEEKINGVTIIGVDVYLEKVVKEPASIDCFKEQVIGKKIERLDRRGKYLLLHLSDGYIIVIHLRMTGRLLYAAQYEDVTKHTHLIFQVSNNYHLRFVDIRQFGTIYLLKEDELETIKGLAILGPEPLSENFTREFLNERLNKKTKKIKQVLLDQDVVAGLGNIYADEVLFESGILPDRRANTLTEDEINRLYHSIVKIVKEAICHRGTSFRDYVDGEGEKGDHQKYLKVYQRTDQPCNRCQCHIKKEKIAGRSSHFCPGCQN